jgi:hypothetical protein
MTFVGASIASSAARRGSSCATVELELGPFATWRSGRCRAHRSCPLAAVLLLQFDTHRDRARSRYASRLRGSREAGAASRAKVRKAPGPHGPGTFGHLPHHVALDGRASLRPLRDRISRDGTTVSGEGRLLLLRKAGAKLWRESGPRVDDRPECCGYFTTCPLAVSSTSMLPRVALEYGQIWWAAATIRSACSWSSTWGRLTSSVTARLKAPSPVGSRLT